MDRETANQTRDKRQETRDRPGTRQIDKETVMATTTTTTRREMYRKRAAKRTGPQKLISRRNNKIKSNQVKSRAPPSARPFLPLPPSSSLSFLFSSHVCPSLLPLASLVWRLMRECENGRLRECATGQFQFGIECSQWPRRMA